jgi:DNA helicase-2/ATP-dependent DNA helicase PcrA
MTIVVSAIVIAPGHGSHPLDYDLLKGLTDAQCEAVEHIDGPMLILAGPGSGKTRVVTHRIANLLQHGIRARSILALTFTNKAAEEMRQRLDRLAPGEPVWLGTFHRFCARMLREYAALAGLQQNYTIYDTSDSLATLKRAIEAVELDATHYTPQQLASAISWAKNNLITPDQYEARPGNVTGAIVAKVYPKYQELLRHSNAVDFDDMLMHVALILRDSPEVRAELDSRYRYILVDEYQDTNLAQYAIARAMSIDYPNLSVTGDPDQSIYGWRGATLNNILEFERDYPEVRVVRLEQNYRSTKKILRVADALISHNRRRKAKDLFTDNEEGVPVRLITYSSHHDEAEGIAAQISGMIQSGKRQPKDIAIFYRINALSRGYEAALRDEGIPYQLVRGVEFYQRKEIKDVLSYLLLANNPRDDNAFLRVINTPARGIGRSTIDKLADHANARGLSLLDAAREAGMIESLAKKSAVSVAKFVGLFDRICVHVLRPLEELLGHVLSETEYQDMLKDSEDPDDQDRLANIEELLTAAREFDERHPGDGHLEEFLEQTSLVADTDDWDSTSDRVTLMTMHAAKGLEFPVVFIGAVEKGLIPHERSEKDEAQMEEERRLLFVGITRAKERLQLSLAKRRDFRGRSGYTIPSQFLFELPRDEMEMEERGDVWQPDDLGEFDEPTFDVDEFEDRTPKQIGKSIAGIRLMTAADLAGETSADDASADDFHQGMIVRHPEYGLGKIVALSGTFRNRKATVDFFASVGQKTFVLAASPLKPVRG